MSKIKLYCFNKSMAIVSSVLVIFFSLFTLIIPFFLIVFIPQSNIGSYLNNYIFLSLIPITILFYFIYTGIFFYSIRLDAYIINITSFRTISSLFSKKDYVDIPHNMLKSYRFFDRPFTFNTILMIKIKNDNARVIVKRFTLSFLSDKDKREICRQLDEIIIT